ncbi:MAG TPA: CGNR zinc finger domain-containing protein [Acidimicrobiales bacterium]|nr:CGNR zinc finger domain-containing protein [Acidimicrobiales bacterium]
MAEQPPFLWTGNHPATDLCNTEPVIDGERVELLPDFDGVVSWAKVAGVSSRAHSFDITDREAVRTLRFVRRLRAKLRAALDPTSAEPNAIHGLNEVLGEAPGVLHAATSSGHSGVSLKATAPAAQLRLDIAAATLDIFHQDPRRIRRCAGPTCVLLFLDVSKSGRRRWCDMAVCGNRAKVAAHHARVRRA